VGIQTVTGVAASLKWAYHQAATLSGWTVTKTDDGWALTATVETKNDVYVDAALAAGRLTFVAPHATGAWRWPVTALQIVGASLSATLGPKE